LLDHGYVGQQVLIRLRRGKSCRLILLGYPEQCGLSQSTWLLSLLMAMSVGDILSVLDVLILR